MERSSPWFQCVCLPNKPHACHMTGCCNIHVFLTSFFCHTIAIWFFFLYYDRCWTVASAAARTSLWTVSLGHKNFLAEECVCCRENIRKYKFVPPRTHSPFVSHLHRGCYIRHVLFSLSFYRCVQPHAVWLCSVSDCSYVVNSCLHGLQDIAVLKLLFFPHSYHASWYYQSFIYSPTDVPVSCLKKQYWNLH